MAKIMNPRWKRVHAPYTIPMGIQIASMLETPEEAEIRRRKSAARRIKILMSIIVLAGGARFLIKDPVRKPPPDYTKRNIKIVPGMLDAMPQATKDKLGPQMLAKMAAADEQARREKLAAPQVAAADKSLYRVADPIDQNDADAKIIEEKTFAMTQRRRIDSQRETVQERMEETRQVTLVKFSSGGHIFAERAERRPTQTEIRIDKTMEAGLPNRWVAVIQKDAADWKEPVPAGRVRLKPAKGITVILDRGSASRVTVKKFDEI